MRNLDWLPARGKSSRQSQSGRLRYGVGMSEGRRVVLLGAGHAHLYTLRRADEFIRRGAKLIAIAPEQFWYSGLATGILGGVYRPGLDQVDVERLVRGAGGSFILDRAIGFNLAEKTVILERNGPMKFDLLSLNLGSQAPLLPGERGVTNAFSVKPIERLWRLREELERQFDQARGRIVRVVVAGAGVSACELAANMFQLAKRRGGVTDISVCGGAHPLQQLPAAAAKRVIAKFESDGIHLVAARVMRIERDAAILDQGERRPFDVFVNATGLQPANIICATGLATDTDGALIVDETLRSSDNPLVFGAGDCIAFKGHALPRIGVYAIRQAPVLHQNLLAALTGSKLTRFKPQKHYLWIMNFGDGTGLAVRGGLFWQGRLAFLLKDWIDRRFLRKQQ